MNKKIGIWVVALALLVGVGYLGINTVDAQETDFVLPPMIQRLIERFNLDENEVSLFLQEEKQVKLEEHKARLEESLNTAVSEGTITEGQKNALLAKMEEYKASKEKLWNLPKEEKHQAMQEMKTEFETWAEENGINLAELNLWPHGSRAGSHWHKGFGW